MIVTTDQEEYCKYESGKEEIVVTLSGTLIAGASYTFSIRRPKSASWPDEYRTVMSKTVIATTSNVTAGTISQSFLLGMDDLDIDGIARCISGKYDVRVSDGTTSWEKAEQIQVSLVSYDELRKDWCHGVPLRSAEVNSVKFQPRTITGVTILELSQETFIGPKKLVLGSCVVGGQTLQTISWDGGAPVQIMPGVTSEYLLTDEGDLNYAVAKIDATLLPVANSVTERLLVVQEEMRPEIIYRRIKNAMNTVESQLGFAIEPQYYTTMPLLPGHAINHQYQTPYWDRIGRPADYVVPIDAYKWPQFRLPYQWCIKLHRLYGYHSVDKIIEVDNRWWDNTIDRMSGHVTLIPALASFARWTVFTHPMLAPFYMHRNIAGFWQFDATFGLPDLKDADRQVVREMLARMAAISVLTEAQRAYQGGMASESTSRDGISASRSFNPGGAYANTIQSHQQWLMIETPRIKAKLGGILFGMLGEA